MDRSRAAIAVVLIALMLLGANVVGPGRQGLAQDGTPQAVLDPVDVSHPAQVQAGGCDDPGEVIEPLSELTKTQGEEVGAPGAIIASRSFTTVPMSLDQLLAEDHAINIHLSAQEIDTYLACGEIGGVADFNGALTIGLKDIGGRGHSGIAYLAPDADGVSTGILIFMTEDEVTGSAVVAGATPVAADGTGEGTGASEVEETPAAEPPEEPSTEETVEVSLTEWAINMPTELEAGTIIFEVINDGTVPHTFQITGETAFASLEAAIGPGETALLTVDLEPGVYTVICPLGDGAHREIGMELALTVN